MWIFVETCKGQLISKCLFGVFNFFQKNERKQVELRYHYSKVKFICSFFGRIHCLTICFWVLLTFRKIGWFCLIWDVYARFGKMAKCLQLILSLTLLPPISYTMYSVYLYVLEAIVNKVRKLGSWELWAWGEQQNKWNNDYWSSHCSLAAEAWERPRWQ